MTRTVRRMMTAAALWCGAVVWMTGAQADERGKEAVQAASRAGRFAFIVFYRTGDEATKSMHRTVRDFVADRSDAVLVPVNVSKRSETHLIEQFDATRLPMPAVAVVAPNGAVCSVLPGKVSGGQLASCIVSQGQAECLKSLQDGKLVVLCAQPSSDASLPRGVKEFVADDLYRNRTRVVSVLSSEPGESRFLRQLRVSAPEGESVVALMAPPGVMVGVFGADVSGAEMAEKLAAAGKCCDDENCRYRRTAGRRRGDPRQ